MTNKPRCILTIPGIYADCKSIDAWHERAVDEVQTRGARARCYEYSCRVTTRRWFGAQHKRARQIADLIDHYSQHGFVIDSMAHSNGAELLAMALSAHDVKIRHAHLIAGACDLDFDKNGLNQAIAAGRVERVYVYASKGDKTLGRYAAWSQKLLGWIGCGYGTLGFHGPENVAKANADKVRVYRDDTMDHSDWLRGSNFYWMIDRVMA